jgi:hypothetical protein
VAPHGDPNAVRRVAVLAGGLVAIIGAAAGCAHHGGPNAPASPQPSVGAATSVASASSGSFPNRIATQWAHQIPGCVGVHGVTADKAASAASAMAGHAALLRAEGSLATCSVEDHPLLILAFAERATEAATETALQHVEWYLAAGSGWVAVAARPDSAAQALSIVQGAALAVGGTVLKGSPGGG